MDTLSKCTKGDKLRVVKIHTTGDLKQRLISFGVMKDADIEVLELSPTKSTIEIKVGKMRIALRGSEAEKIEVQKI
ncbi:MAG: ferrous iron transport protein A [Campylobacterales bacterium]|nr:ferrous iron transport protein A [Campylobacterales bacterium]